MSSMRYDTVESHECYSIHVLPSFATAMASPPGPSNGPQDCRVGKFRLMTGLANEPGASVGTTVAPSEAVGSRVTGGMAAIAIAVPWALIALDVVAVDAAVVGGEPCPALEQAAIPKPRWNLHCTQRPAMRVSSWLELSQISDG